MGYRWIIFVFITFFAFNQPIEAQYQPLKEITFDGNTIDVFYHSVSGIPIVKSSRGYTGIHPETFEKIWEVKRSGINALSEKISGEDAAEFEYRELYYGPFVFVAGNIINIGTGKLLVDAEKENITTFGRQTLFPASDILLVELYSKKMAKLYAIDLKDQSLLWDTQIGETSALGASVGYAASIDPFVSVNNNIIYAFRKYLMVIDPKNGEIKWKAKQEPGEVLYSEEGARMAIAERSSGLSMAKLGKKIVVIDTETGENSWKKEIKLDGNIKFLKPYENKFFVVHDEGFNIYDFNSAKGEGYWKKDFKAKGILDVEEWEEGFAVYYKSKRMLIDKESGKDLWKKPEKLTKEKGQFERYDEYYGAHDNISIEKGSSSIYISNTDIDDYIVVPGYKYIRKGQKAVVIDAYIENSSVQHDVYTIDLRTLALNKGHTGFFKQSVREIDIIKDHVFLATPKRFVVFEDRGEGLTEYDKRKYKDPSSFGRTMLDIGMITASAGYTAAVVSNGFEATSNSVAAKDPGEFNDFVERNYEVSKVASAAGNLFYEQATKRTQTNFEDKYAYFFSKDEGKNLVLFQIDKYDGYEYTSYEFDDRTPIYQIDKVNGLLYYLVDNKCQIFELQK